MISRFHFPDRLPAGGEVALPDALAHHALRVLRLRDGEAVVLFDGSGGEVEARLAVRGKAVFAQLGEARAVERESPLRIVLVQALASGDKMDWVVQKAVELGAHAVQPVQAERSVLRLAGERADKRVAHWQQVAVAACEQCGRNRVPVMHPALTLAQWLQAHPVEQDAPGTQRAVLSLAPGCQPLAQVLAKEAGPVVLLSGPEGGLSPAEEALALQAGFAPVTLGTRILRAETAPLAALALLGAL